jgi:hypothetical protein
MFERKLPKEDGIHHSEDCRIRANTQAESQNRSACKGGILNEAAQCVPHITHEILDEVHSPDIATLFLTLVQSCKRAHGGTPRVLAGHPFGDVFVSLPLDVIAHFFFELSLELTAPK